VTSWILAISLDNLKQIEGLYLSEIISLKFQEDVPTHQNETLLRKISRDLAQQMRVGYCSPLLDLIIHCAKRADYLGADMMKGSSRQSYSDFLNKDQPIPDKGYGENVNYIDAEVKNGVSQLTQDSTVESYQGPDKNSVLATFTDEVIPKQTSGFKYEDKGVPKKIPYGKRAPLRSEKRRDWRNLKKYLSLVGYGK